LNENYVQPPNNHKFYVYLHKRIDNDNIFYVGKGKIHHNKTLKQTFRRAFDKISRTSHWKRINNICGRIVIIEKTFINENDALNYETELILKYKMVKNGGTLVN
jgi:excinuclease UvrABC nuclease subunit